MSPSSADQGTWGSVVSPPSGVREEPRPKWILVHFTYERTHLTTRYLVFSDITRTESDFKNSEILGLETAKQKTQYYNIA